MARSARKNLLSSRVIQGTRFEGHIKEKTAFSPYEAALPAVMRNAFIVGRREFWIDPFEPLKHAFILR
jgi:proline racemase